MPTARMVDLNIVHLPAIWAVCRKQVKRPHLSTRLPHQQPHLFRTALDAIPKMHAFAERAASLCVMTRNCSRSCAMWQIALLSAISLSGAGPLGAPDYTVQGTTTRSVRDFATCFVTVQATVGNAWWFVPDDQGGGVLSNAGASKVGNSYRLRLIDRGNVRSFRVESATRSRPPAPPVANAIDQCT
jgi:hypothetical protein